MTVFEILRKTAKLTGQFSLSCLIILAANPMAAYGDESGIKDEITISVGWKSVGRPWVIPMSNNDSFYYTATGVRYTCSDGAFSADGQTAAAKQLVLSDPRENEVGRYTCS